MSQSAVYEERLGRIMNAVKFNEIDKVPFVPCGNASWARMRNVKLSTYVSDFEKACDVNIDVMSELEVDGTQNTIFSPYLLSGQWLSEVAVPGVDLPDDEMWQVVEKENMTFDEYEKILDRGFDAWYADFLVSNVDDNDKKLIPFFEYVPTANQRFIDAGIPCVTDFLLITPFEYFCGGRSLEAFFMDDLMEEPDLIEKVFKVTLDAMLKKYRGMMAAMKPIGVWIGGWRTAPEMMSPALWERFVWPYVKAYGDLCLEMGVVPIFHLDANWDRAIPYFKEMPAQKCILALDSKTDIIKAREILGDHMCILGDVPAELLAFGTYDEVYEYSTNLIEKVGPKGFILASGCDVPSNAKPENVKAMSDATKAFKL